jgi:hypothetical protein
MRASIRDKKRIEHDMLPQKSETLVKEVRDLDAWGGGFHGNDGRALECRDKQKVDQNMTRFHRQTKSRSR